MGLIHVYEFVNLFGLIQAHGILNVIGWGTLLPIGAITARYMKKFPVECDRWYISHVLCQSAGFVLGTIGWCTGVYLGKISKQQFGRNSHSVLGTIIFVLSTIQVIYLLAL